MQYCGETAYHAVGDRAVGGVMLLRVFLPGGVSPAGGAAPSREEAGGCLPEAGGQAAKADGTGGKVRLRR